MAIRYVLAPAFGLALFLVPVTLAAADPAELKLWPNGVPGEAEEPGETKVQPGNDGVLRVTYVGDPTITVHRAPAETANGCAVVICPGGGYNILAWDKSTYAKVDNADEMSCRPDFMVPIYAAYLGAKDDPWGLSPLVRVTDKTPPTFMAVTLDDKHRGAHAALLLVELKKAGVPAELHVYAKGGHGYGLRPSDNPVCTWPQRCADWMRSSGLLRPGKSSEK